MIFGHSCSRGVRATQMLMIYIPFDAKYMLYKEKEQIYGLGVRILMAFDILIFGHSPFLGGGDDIRGQT